MGERVAVERQATDEDRDLDEGPGGLDVEADPPPTDQPEFYTGEVPPEEELAGPDSPPAANPDTNGGEPRTPGEADTSSEPISTASGAPAPLDRPIKVVVTLRPGANPNDPGGALVAVGAEGHEPALRYLDSSDLTAALAVVPEVLAVALASEERRKPVSASSRPSSFERPPAAAVVVTDGAVPGQSAQQPAASSRRSRGGEPAATQPSLFG